MNYLLAALAGFVQGLTEFLPVSSTGHLAIFEYIFGISPTKFGLTFDASLHLGTLIAVLIFFYKDYIKALNPKNKLFYLLILGTIPAVILGVAFESIIETKARQLWVVGTFLIIFSGVMYLAERFGKQNRKTQHLNPIQAGVVGIFQAFALIPGVSRSGSTISAGLFLGLTREEAARFAFMLSGPIVAGAGTKKLLDALTSQSLNTSELNFFFIGIMSSAIFGYLTIKYFLRYISSKSMTPFIVYRVILGFTLIVIALTAK